MFWKGTKMRHNWRSWVLNKNNASVLGILTFNQDLSCGGDKVSIY